MKTSNRSLFWFPIRRATRVFTLLLAGVAASSIIGCTRQSKTQTVAAVPQEVGVITLKPAPVTLTKELPGRTSAFRVAEVRARVSGIVLKRLFIEGADVNEGDSLYQIDPAPYRATLDSAKGAEARAEASASVARLQEARYRALIETKAISQQEYDNALAALKGSEADLVAAKAAVETAEINLGYTDVTAPVSGRIGRSAVTEGAYVQQSQATLLATIQEIDKMYVDVTQANADVLRLKRTLAAGKLQSTEVRQAKVSLLLEDGTRYANDGVLQFTDVTVDAETGSILLRALFPNPNNELLPGMFVRAQLVEAEIPSALLVPQLAVSHNPQGEATALVIGAGSKVELRTIKAERNIGDCWLVTDGLRPSDQVIIEGIQRVRPGVLVKPISVRSTNTASSALVVAQ